MSSSKFGCPATTAMSVKACSPRSPRPSRRRACSRSASCWCCFDRRRSPRPRRTGHEQGVPVRSRTSVKSAQHDPRQSRPGKPSAPKRTTPDRREAERVNRGTPARLDAGSGQARGRQAQRCARQRRPRALSAPCPGSDYSYTTETTAYSRWPAGASTCAMSPSVLPISARAIGDETEIRPALMSASSSPTI